MPPHECPRTEKAVGWGTKRRGGEAPQATPSTPTIANSATAATVERRTRGRIVTSPFLFGSRVLAKTPGRGGRVSQVDGRRKLDLLPSYARSAFYERDAPALHPSFTSARRAARRAPRR